MNCTRCGREVEDDSVMDDLCLGCQSSDFFAVARAAEDMSEAMGNPHFQRKGQT